MRLGIVEDNAAVRDSLALLLGGEPGFEIAGAWGSAEEAWPALRAAAADVLIVDLGLPGESGIEFIRRVRQELPTLEMMAFSIHEDRATVFAAIKAGASGFLVKGATPRELIEALRSLQEGGAPMSPRIARAIVRELQEGGVADVDLLSPREREILVAVDRSLTYKEIGAQLGLSPHTVHTHIKKIYEKLQARDRRDALAVARRKGLL